VEEVSREVWKCVLDTYLEKRIMDKIDFKKILTSTLSEYGFVSKNNVSRAQTSELIIVVATQKSSYDNSYYLNYGFLIKALTPELTMPKDYQCDIFGRLHLNINGVILPALDIEKISLEEFSSALKMSLDERIKPVLEYGLSKYFQILPEAISTVRINAKRYLGL
jgi:hypothetical protein